LNRQPQQRAPMTTSSVLGPNEERGDVLGGEQRVVHQYTDKLRAVKAPNTGVPPRIDRAAVRVRLSFRCAR
jgi:hypothetical protein